MNTGLKYWITAGALAVWLVLGWNAGPWLNLQGNDVWIVRAALTLIGFAAFATLVWWFKGMDADRLREMAEEGERAGDEIDVLMGKAQVRMGGLQPGQTSFSDWPLLLLMGEGGSAKTSVVLQCGLEPQLLAGQTVQNNIPVPTHTLNLWLAAPFIVAEAGAPLLREPPRWAHLIRRFSPSETQLLGKGKLPPRLALLCIDCEKFLAPGAADALGTSIEHWRARLRETSHLLGINLPVYVLFTRADRLQFFQDYVAPMTNEEAAQVFGASLPTAVYTADNYAEQKTAAISSAFDHLLQGLANWRLSLLNRRLDSPQAPPIYEFPREFKKVRATLVPLLVDICRPSEGRTSPFLRGFYFTGVRPLLVSAPKSPDEKEEPSPAEAVEGNLSATRMFDIKKAAAAAKKLSAGGDVETRRVPQWVFLEQLFKEALFNDSTALQTSALSTKVGLHKRFVLAALMALLLVLILGFSVSSIRNKRLENQIAAAVQDVSEIHLSSNQLPSLDDLSKLEALRQTVETLETYKGDGVPLSLRWGLYVGRRLYPDVRKIYFRHFQDLLFRQAQRNLLATLSSLPATPGANDRYDPVYDALKAYLMTTAESSRASAGFLSPALLRAWATGGDISLARIKLAQRQFEFYSVELKSGNPFPAQPDDQAVDRARGYLSKFSASERAYRVLLAEAEGSNPPVDFNRRYPAAAEAVAEQTQVSGAFTQGGWTFMQGAFENPAAYFSADAWVLGQEKLSKEDLAKRADDLRRAYQQDYIEQWRKFLRDASVNHPVSLTSASQELQRLSSDQSPLLALFCVATQNTSVDQPDVAKAFQAVQSVAPHDCQNLNAGPATTAYIKSLSDLQACVDRADNAPADRKDNAKSQCLGDVAQSEQAVKTIAQGFQPDPDAHSDQTVEDLLLSPVNTVEALLRPGPVSAAGLCQQMGALEAEFPFHAQSNRDVSLSDLARVFAPGKGALSQFYNSALKTLLIPQGAGYAPNPSSHQTVRPQFLTFFEHAMDVQRALYAGGGSQMQLRYTLHPRATDNVTSLNLSIDGQTINYSGGAGQAIPFTWPGTAGQGVRLSVTIPGGTQLGFPSYDGLWGVFRFFDDATVLQHNGNVLTLQWVLGGERPVTGPNGKPVAVEFDLDTFAATPILEKGFLSSLRCVPTVAK